MERTVLKYAPDYWTTTNTSPSSQFVVSPHEEISNDFGNLSSEINSAFNRVPKKVERIQNIHDYGQVLIRGQMLCALYPTTKYYRVRRFIKLKSHYRETALRYNLDHRRCGLSTLIFQKRILDIVPGDIVFIVQVITQSPGSEYLEPQCSSDYFIDYIVTF